MHLVGWQHLVGQSDVGDNEVGFCYRERECVGLKPVAVNPELVLVRYIDLFKKEAAVLSADGCVLHVTVHIDAGMAYGMAFRVYNLARYGKTGQGFQRDILRGGLQRKHLYFLGLAFITLLLKDEGVKAFEQGRNGIVPVFVTVGFHIGSFHVHPDVGNRPVPVLDDAGHDAFLDFLYLHIGDIQDEHIRIRVAIETYVIVAFGQGVGQGDAVGTEFAGSVAGGEFPKQELLALGRIVRS